MKYNLTYRANVTSMTIVSEQLELLGIAYHLGNAGEIEILDDISEARLCQLQVSLDKYSIVILEDQRACLVQRIKNILDELSYENKGQAMTHSAYLAKELGLSYGYISNLFTLHTYTTIEHYLILLKIERAKKMILDDILTLKEISYELNYSSVGHFSRQFKKTTGLTISVFKKIIFNRRNRQK